MSAGLVVPIAEEHARGFHAALDRVARERLYLAMVEAPAFEQVLEFVRGNLAKGNPQFVALEAGVVVGWCDIARIERPVYCHGGVLGMGVIPEHRGRGLGAALMAATLGRAREAGFTRVELAVYEGNDRARDLYRRFGFVEEGVRRKAVRIDGRYRDAIEMAVLFGDAA